ncbi:MAG: acyloxyacyl hydrolase [Verrucomicrobiia bacterium]
MTRRHHLATCILSLLATTALQAGVGSPAEKLQATSLSQPDIFVEDRINVSLMTGPLFSHVGLGPSHPHFNYQMTNLRLGWMLNTPSDDAGWLRGNFEAIGELSASGVFSGFGSVVIGPTFLVRYNFVQPGWKFVPYVQVGAGFVYTDAYETRSQRAIGQAWEFTPQGSIGFRYLLNDHWSINAEAIYHHISNADMSTRNLGINAVGGLVGASYFFDKLWN